MNDAARKTLELIKSGGDALSPEHIETTRAAFPVAFSTIRAVYPSESGEALACLGVLSDQDHHLTTAWVSNKNGGGYQTLRPRPQPEPERSRMTRFMLEVQYRIRRAWDALKGKDE